MSMKYIGIFGVAVAAAVAWAPLSVSAKGHGGGFKCISVISESIPP